MSAYAVPVQVHEEQLHLEIRPNNNRLTDVLTKLSTTVSRNAKALVQLQEEVTTLKTLMTSNQDNTKKMFNRVDELRVALHDEVQRNHTRITSLEQSVVFQPQLQQELNGVWQTMNQVKGFMDEIESGGGERVSKFVSQYIQEFVPKWYEGVSATMWQKVAVAIAKAADEQGRKLEQRAIQCDDKAKHLVQIASASSSKMLVDTNNERKEDLKQLKQFTEEQLRQLHHNVENILATARNEAENQRHLVEGRFVTLEDSASALRTTLCLEDELCRELCKLVGGAEKAQYNIPLERASSDVRVQRVAQIPHFAVLRASLQKELSDKLEFMKVDLHQCFVQEMVDVQRELKGKIGASKFGELLAQYRDTQLYSQVKGLLTEAQELRNTKVDNALFLDALKSKADTKSVERLVDRNVLTGLVGGVSNRVEELEHAMLKIGEKHDKLHFQNLRLQASVETRGTLVDSSRFAGLADSSGNAGGGGGGNSSTAHMPRRPSSLAIADLIKKKPGRSKLQQMEDDAAGVISAAVALGDHSSGPPRIPDAVVISDQRGIPGSHQKKKLNNPNDTASAGDIISPATAADSSIVGGGNSTGANSGGHPLKRSTNGDDEEQQVLSGSDAELGVKMEGTMEFSDSQTMGSGATPASPSTAAKKGGGGGGTVSPQKSPQQQVASPTGAAAPTGHHQHITSSTTPRRPVSGSVAAANRQLHFGSAVANKNKQLIGPDDKRAEGHQPHRGVVPMTGAQAAYAAAIDLEPTTVQKLTQPRRRSSAAPGGGKGKGAPPPAPGSTPAGAGGRGGRLGTSAGHGRSTRGTLAQPPASSPRALRSEEEEDYADTAEGGGGAENSPSFTQQMADRELAQMILDQKQNKRGDGHHKKVVLADREERVSPATSQTSKQSGGGGGGGQPHGAAMDAALDASIMGGWSSQ